MRYSQCGEFLHIEPNDSVISKEFNST